MDRYRTFLLFPFLLLLFSCIKPVEVDIPPHEPKLTVNSLFLRGRHIEVYLSASKHIYDTLTCLSGNGIVEITHDAYVERLKYAGEGKYVTRNIVATSGEKYSIKAWYPGLDTVYAEDVVPKKVTFEISRFIPIAGMDEEGDPYSEYEITFNDPPDEDNYYEITKHNEEESVEDGWTDILTSILTSTDPYILNEGDGQYYYPNILLSDELFDGKKVVLILKASSHFKYNGEWVPIPVQHIYLRSISENYYRYKKKLLRHIPNQYHDMWDGTGSPVQLYTNIENGYGIFAAYAEDEETLEVK